MIAKTRKSTLAAATVVALTLTGLGVSAIAATSAQNNAATGYVVCVSKTTGDMKLRTKSTCPKGFSTKVFGAKGPAGVAGAQGAAGASGPQGPAGIAGPQGPSGAGLAGPAGPVGPAGIAGAKGDIGDIGATGIPGEPGEQGPIGAQGAQGEQGPKGEQGEQGAQGEQGIQGAAGLNGDAATVYTAYSGGQDRPLAIWSDDPLDYKIMTTSKVLTQGSYLVTATSSFRQGTDPVTCWIKLDLTSYYLANVYSLRESTGGNPVTSQAVVNVPQGGSTISFYCVNISGTASSMTHFDAFMSALKIGQVNP